MSKLWEPNPSYDPSKPQSLLYNMPYKRLYDNLTPEQLSELLRDAKRLHWRVLDLRWCGLAVIPNALGELEDLRILGLANVLEKTTYDRLKRLIPNIFTGLSDSITCLTNLQSLDLSHTPIVEVPETITRLSSLQALSLSGTKVRKVPETITRLSSLQVLNLSNTDISEVPETITRLSSLQSLDLSYTQIREVPETITRLSSLQTLDLSGCHLKAIPYALVKLGLPFVIDDPLFVDNGINLTGVKLDEGDLQLFTQPRDVIEAAYLEQVRVRECKVIFLGDGAAGKSSLIQRMVHGDFDPAKLPTDGVKTTKWETPLLNLAFTLRILDFGGQEIMHSMHRCFLTAHTVYVVVCESRDDADIDNEAARWLETVKAFAPDCPVILALNKCDLNANVSVNERDLRERNPKLKCVLKTSAKNEPDSRYGVNHLIQAIGDEIPGALNRYKVNADMLGIKQTLEDMKEDYISSERYREICAKHHITDAALQYSLLGFFRDLGVAYYYESNAFDTRLESVRVLNPEWLTNGIYRLILRTPESGFLSHQTIKDTLRDGYAGDVHSDITYTPEETEYILHVMRYFEISHDMGNGVEMLPLKMPKTPPPTLDNFNKQNALHLRWEGAYLPNNLIHRLLIRKFPELDRNCVWRTGGHFVQEGGGCEALAEMNEKALNVYVNGERDCRQYLETFRSVIQAILTDLNLKVSEVICCTVDGQEGAVPYEDVVQQYYDKRDEIYIPGIHKYVNPAALLRDTYYNWEQEAARYRQRMGYEMFRAPEKEPEKSELDDEKTRAEIAQINAEIEKNRAEIVQIQSEADKNKSETDKNKVETKKIRLSITTFVALFVFVALLICILSPDMRRELVEALISLLTGLL